MKACCLWLVFLAGCAAEARADQLGRTLLFMAGDEWRKAPWSEKTALAADFMRVFCVRPTMSPALLADCLDKKNGASLFDDAIGCARDLQD